MKENVKPFGVIDVTPTPLSENGLASTASKEFDRRHMGAGWIVYCVYSGMGYPVEHDGWYEDELTPAA